MKRYSFLCALLLLTQYSFALADRLDDIKMQLDDMETDRLFNQSMPPMPPVRSGPQRNKVLYTDAKGISWMIVLKTIKPLVNSNISFEMMVGSLNDNVPMHAGNIIYFEAEQTTEINCKNNTWAWRRTRFYSADSRLISSGKYNSPLQPIEPNTVIALAKNFLCN